MKTTPMQFFRQVKQEISKITWPTRKEALAVSVQVLIFSVVATAFFFVVDLVCQWLIQKILGL
jgi:preprotein translocase subunit SecE